MQDTCHDKCLLLICQLYLGTPVAVMEEPGSNQSLQFVQL